MREYVLFTIAAAFVFFAPRAGAQTPEACVNVTCSGHGNCVIAPSGFPMCACHDGYVPDSVNGLSCQPAYQPPPQPAYQPPPVQQTVYVAPPVSQSTNPYSDFYYPWNNMTPTELKKEKRGLGVSIAMSYIVMTLCAGGLVAGIILLLADQIVAGAVLTTLFGLGGIGCASASGKMSVKRSKLKKYMELRGIATVNNPYLAVRDDLLLAPLF